MTDIEALVEIEKIKKLRILYSHYFDSNDLDSLAALFTDDVVCEFGVHGTWIGKEELRKNYKAVHTEMDKLKNGSYPYLHVTTNHWVEIKTPDSAEGRCYLIDMVTHFANSPLLLLGIYDDEYKKMNGTWKIHRTRLDYLWPNRQVVGGVPGKRIPPAL